MRTTGTASSHPRHSSFLPLNERHDHEHGGGPVEKCRYASGPLTTPLIDNPGARGYCPRRRDEVDAVPARLLTS